MKALLIYDIEWDIDDLMVDQWNEEYDESENNGKWNSVSIKENLELPDEVTISYDEDLDFEPDEINGEQMTWSSDGYITENQRNQILWNEELDNMITNYLTDEFHYCILGYKYKFYDNFDQIPETI